MDFFLLPEEFIDASWDVKHKIVREYISKFKNIYLLIGKRMNWNTSIVKELLLHLNLVPKEPFEYSNYHNTFWVKCNIHEEEEFDTSLERVSKGHICKLCLSTSRRYTQQEAEEKAMSLGYTLLEEYKTFHEEHWFLCPKKHLIHIRFSAIFRNQCKYCGNERKSKLLRTSFDEIVNLFQELNIKYPKVTLLTTRKEYEEIRSKAGEFRLRYTSRCCGEEKPGSLAEIKAESLYCLKCYGEIINSFRKLPYLEIVRRFQDKELSVLTSEEKYNLEYKNVTYRIKYKCKKETCGYQNTKSVRDILISGCPNCHPNYYNKPGNTRSQWSDKIKKLCSYNCINCGYHGIERMEAHHLYSRYHFPKFQYDLWNGVCLCIDCHRLNEHSFHKYSKKSTPKIFFAWLKEWGEKCQEESYFIHSLVLNKDVFSTKDDLSNFY